MKDEGNNCFLDLVEYKFQISKVVSKVSPPFQPNQTIQTIQTVPGNPLVFFMFYQPFITYFLLFNHFPLTPFNFDLPNYSHFFTISYKYGEPK